MKTFIKRYWVEILTFLFSWTLFAWHDFYHSFLSNLLSNFLLEVAASIGIYSILKEIKEIKEIIYMEKYIRESRKRTQECINKWNQDIINRMRELNENNRV